MITRRKFVAGSIAGSLVPMVEAIGEECSPLSPMIDSHVHVWKHDPQFPFAKGSSPPVKDASVEMLLDLMHQNRVARTVLIQVIHYRWDNRYLADVLRRYPKQFRGVCRVDPQNPASPDELSRLTEEHGFHGVRLSPAANAEGDWIRGPLMAPLWRRCSQLRIPMTLLLSGSRLPDLKPLLEAHTDLQVVIDHMADVSPSEPEQLSLLLSLAKYPNVFIKLSHLWSLSGLPYPYPDMRRQVKELCAHFGANRLMWGTDWPISLKQLSYPRAVQLYRDHLDFLPISDRQQILFKTVQRVWPFGVDCTVDAPQLSSNSALAPRARVQGGCKGSKII